MLRVTVDPVRPDKDLQIPKQMSDDKHNQNDAGDCDDHFLPNRRAIKGSQNIHARIHADPVACVSDYGRRSERQG